MSDKSLLVLGAGHFMIPALKIAKSAGVKLIIIDGNPQAEGFKYGDVTAGVDIKDADQALSIGKKYDIDGVLPLNDFGIATAAYISQELGIPGIDEECALCSTDKIRMRKEWKKKGSPCPEFRIVSDSDSALKAADLIGYPLIIKPPDSMGGSRGVVRVNDNADLVAFLDYTFSQTNQENILIEECVIGSEHSVESVVSDGEIGMAGISVKTKLPPPYRVDKSVTYPAALSPGMEEEIRRVNAAAIKALGIDNSAAHLELAVTKKGIRLFEIGPRVGAGGIIASLQIPHVYGIPLMEQVIKVVLGIDITIENGISRKGSDFRFITPPPGKVVQIQGFEQAVSRKEVVAGSLFIRAGEIAPEVKSGGDRKGYVIVNSETRSGAVSCADTIESEILFRYEQ